MANVFALRKQPAQPDVRAVVHDLNNLLTAIAGYAQLVREAECLTPEVRQDVDEIGEAAVRATRLVRSLQTGA
jgi:signal transduction histidine kinase